MVFYLWGGNFIQSGSFPLNIKKKKNPFILKLPYMVTIVSCSEHVHGTTVTWTDSTL